MKVKNKRKKKREKKRKNKEMNKNQILWFLLYDYFTCFCFFLFLPLVMCVSAHFQNAIKILSRRETPMRI